MYVIGCEERTRAGNLILHYFTYQKAKTQKKNAKLISSSKAPSRSKHI